MEQQAKAAKRVAKQDKSEMPYITLVCTQLRLAKGLPTIKVDYVPTTWGWQNVRLELRQRARCAVDFVFEGRMVQDDESWASCVAALHDDLSLIHISEPTRPY